MLIVDVLRALVELLTEWLFGERRLSRHRLLVNTKGVDPHQLLSTRVAS